MEEEEEEEEEEDDDVILNCIPQIFLTCTSDLFTPKTHYTGQLNIQANLIKEKRHNLYNFRNQVKKIKKKTRGIYEKYLIYAV
jgi:hypothetical protein